MTVTVIVVTLNRPDCVRRCLNCLLEQQPRPDQVIVVDASADDLTRTATAEFPGVLYLRNDNGFGRMTASRNIGLKRAVGEMIAFVDDDAFARAVVQILKREARVWFAPQLGRHCAALGQPIRRKVAV